MTAVALYHKFS